MDSLAIVVATLAGPVLAVQAQKWVERWRERQNRKMWVFQTIMSTRAAKLTAEHVRALNMIDVAFYGVRRFGQNRRTVSEQAVLDKWKEYLDELYVPWDTSANNEARIARRTDLFIDLLVNIGTDVRYRFDRVQLLRGGYSPMAHDNESLEQQRLRSLAIDVFSGNQPLKMDIGKFPVNEAAAQGMIELHSRLSAALDGKRTLSVKLESKS